jgi:hypothetical protein
MSVLGRSFVVLAFMLVSAPALAQEKLPAQVYACAKIDDAGQRHACFDALVPELKKAAPAIASAPSSALQQQQVATLGLPAAPNPLTAPVATPGLGKPKSEEVDMVQLAVQAIGTGGDGKARITMANGQVWRQVDTGRLRNIGDGPPWTAKIRKGALGSYLMTVGNSQGVHVERVN